MVTVLEKVHPSPPPHGSVIGLVLALAVEDHVAVAEAQPVARTGHDALDEVHVGLARAWAGRTTWPGGGSPPPQDSSRSTPAGGWKTTTSPTDGSLKRSPMRLTSTRWPSTERRDHRLARDPVRLDEEGLDAEREPERDGHDDDELEERAAGCRAARPPEVLLGWSRRARGSRGGGLAGVGVARRSRRRRRPRRSRRRRRRVGLERLRVGGVAGSSASARQRPRRAGSCSRPASTASSGPV